jgi:predicted transcriptional regulator
MQTAQLYVSDKDIRLASGVTDGFCSISLFFKDGGYDSLRDLVSHDSSAIGWGKELFDYFQASSTQIKSL